MEHITMIKLSYFHMNYFHEIKSIVINLTIIILLKVNEIKRN